MEKIKVIFTGGTIGSLADGNDISPNAKTKYMLIENYGKNLDRFECVNPLFILSENANLGNVLQMAEEIKKAQEENVKGIILTHGTDTLAYTSAYLSFLVKCKVPVVLVSSNYILTDSKANGNINFETAVKLIDSKVRPNIYVAYKNPTEDFTSIHLGSRMCEPMPYSDCFYSPVGQRFGIYKNNKLVLENTKVDVCNKTFNFSKNITKKGIVINPYTGLDYSVYKNLNCDFVLHNLYHSGTANTEDFESQDTNLLKFAINLKEKNIPLYLCNIQKRDVNYNSTNKMLKQNVKFLYNMLTNVALAKLVVAYNFLPNDNIEEFLNSNIAGEILED